MKAPNLRNFFKRAKVPDTSSQPSGQSSSSQQQPGEGGDSGQRSAEASVGVENDM